MSPARAMGERPGAAVPAVRRLMVEDLGVTGCGRIDTVLEEVPVALVYNGISHAVMLATPGDLDDFALGFSLSEGIVRAADELYECELESACADQGLVLQLRIAAARFVALRQRRRQLAGRTGCGLCGVDSLQAMAPAPVSVSAALGGERRVAAEAVRHALAAMGALQPLHRLTGGAHAAAWVNRAGEVLLVREDVGRHNALDKLLGAVVRAGLPRGDGFVLCTSRASYEMVHKTASLGVGLLVAVSAPTARAVALAERCGLTLVAFARDHRQVIYSHPQRLSRPA